MTSVAERAGVTRMTIHRHMRDRAFLREYKQSISDELLAACGQSRHVIAELSYIGFSDVRQLFDESGNLIPIRKLPQAVAAAVSSVEIVKRKTKDGDTETVKKIRLWDKNNALAALAKYFGLITDRLEVSGPDGGPIEVNSNVSVDSLPLVVRQLLVLVSNGKELDSELQSTLQAKLGPMFAEFLAERREQMAASGNGSGLQPAAIEASYRVESDERKPRTGRKPAPLSTDDLESI